MWESESIGLYNIKCLVYVEGLLKAAAMYATNVVLSPKWCKIVT